MRSSPLKLPRTGVEAERLRDLIEESLPPRVRVGAVKLRPGPARLATHALIGTYQLPWRGQPLLVDTAVTVYGYALTLPSGSRPDSLALVHRLRRHDIHMETITETATGWARLLALLQGRHLAHLAALSLRSASPLQGDEQALREVLCRLTVLDMVDPERRRIAEALLPCWHGSPAELLETVEALLT